MENMEIINILKIIDRDTPAEIHLTGRYLRDIVRKKESNKNNKNSEIEIIVRHVGLKVLTKIFSTYGRVEFNRITNCIRVYFENGATVTAILSQDKNSLRNDALHNLFTINCMCLPIRYKVTKDNIIDHFGGLKDIQKRCIKLSDTFENTIRRDTLMPIKAITALIETKYKLYPNIIEGINNTNYTFEGVHVESLRNEFIKIVMSDKPSKYIKMLQYTNMLEKIIPELSACVGVAQNEKYHKHDVFTHCILACDNAPLYINIRLAALLHDVGKAVTKHVINNQITFYNHEVVGSKIVKKILKRLSFDKDIIKEVVNLVYLHMYNYEPEKWTDSAVRRFIKNVGITEQNITNIENFPLFLLRRAERMSYGHNIHAVSLRQQQLEEHIKRVFNEQTKPTTSELKINGNDIMNYFNISEGPTIGAILKHLLKAVTSGVLPNEKDVLIEESKIYLSNMR